MSIDLPRSFKELHFTGSVKALAPERPAKALGQERPKGPPPPPPSRAVPSRPANVVGPPPKPVRSGDVYLADPQLTPYIGARPSERSEAAQPLKLTTARGQLVSIDEDVDLLTDSLDRDFIDAALFPIARRENASQPAPNLPVPHFRSAAEAKAHHAEPATIVVKAAKGGSLPLGAWLMAALIAGIVSYQLAPQAVESVAQAVRSLDAR
jgi:hypothetical protein